MAKITPSLPPGNYTQPITITWTFENDVSEYQNNDTNAPLALSKYIAYDDLDPPNPFLATTQDGKGNVVYDAGFPKYYNSYSNSVPPNPEFSDLPPAFKFFYNALNFIANKEKTLSGNKKILVLGDCPANGSYNPKDAVSASGFKRTVDMICQVGEFTPTYKIPSDYNNIINPTLDELNQYCAVVFFGVYHSTESDNLISQSGISNLLAFRELGNGLFFITDHGSNLTSINQAISTGGGTGFFRTLNKVVVNFGAYFSGTINRTPVNVGYLRQHYGDHPLYNNLLDSEYIQAGSSESRVVVISEPAKEPVTFTTSINAYGAVTYSFLLIMNNGDVETVKFTYTYSDNSEDVFFNWVDDNGDPVNTLLMGLHHYDAPSPKINDDSIHLAFGIIEHNDTRVGEFHLRDGVSKTIYYTQNRKLDNGDLLRLKLIYPTEYTLDLPVQSDSLTRKLVFTDIEGMIELFDEYIQYTEGESKVNQILRYMNLKPYKLNPPDKTLIHLTNTISEINDRIVGKYDLPAVNAIVFTNPSERINYMANNTPEPGELVIDYNTGTIHGYQMSGWDEIDGDYETVFELNRFIDDKYHGKRYRVIKNNTIVQEEIPDVLIY